MSELARQPRRYPVKETPERPARFIAGGEFSGMSHQMARIAAERLREQSTGSGAEVTMLRWTVAHGLAIGRMNHWGHAAFRPRELEDLLGTDKNGVRAAIDAGIRCGVFRPESVPTCLVVDTGMYQDARTGGMHMVECQNSAHKDFCNTHWLGVLGGQEPEPGLWDELLKNDPLTAVDRIAPVLIPVPLPARLRPRGKRAIEPPKRPGLKPVDSPAPARSGFGGVVSQPAAAPAAPQCQQPGCKFPAVANGYCSQHDWRVVA
jgi:hypothetical protein